MAILTHPSKLLLIRECAQIDTPAGRIKLGHIDEIVDVLDHFLASPTSESRVAGLATKIGGAIAAAATASDVSSFAVVLETLATSFEPFLKKVGLIKFAGDTLRLDGNSDYVGILEQTLGRLLNGELQKRRSSSSLPSVAARLVSFAYNPVTPVQHVHRQTHIIRNRVHEAQQHSFADIMKDLRTILGSYCLAIDETLPFIRPNVDPSFQHLVRLREKVRSRIPFYIDNQGNERVAATGPLDALLAVEWSDRQGAQSRSQAEMALAGPIRDIARTKKQFWLVGEPGCGKSTSVETLAAEAADLLLGTGRNDRPIPVLIQATLLSENYQLIDAVRDLLGIGDAELDRFLLADRIQLFIDGLNEASDVFRPSIVRQLRQLLVKHSSLPFVIATRKNSLDSSLDVPVFDILPFNDENIREFISRALPAQEKAQDLFDVLTEPGSRFEPFARNPLLLSMICAVARDGALPDNRARILQLFTTWLLQRESGPRLGPVLILESILSELAFTTRERAVAILNPDEAVIVVQHALRDRGETISVVDVMTRLTVANLIKIDTRRGVGFVHELLLEYYAARAIDRKVEVGAIELDDILDSAAWHEAIRIYAGLLDQPEDFLGKVAARNILLAVRCITAGAQSSEKVERLIVSESRKCIEGGASSSAKEAALSALLELGSKFALRVVVRLPFHQNSLFERALWQCERPEHVSARLLRFGFTGRDRLHTCICAFRGRRVTRRFLNSAEVGEAQTVLLQEPTTLRFVEAVADMGLSDAARPAAEQLLDTVIRKPGQTTALVACCLRLAVQAGLALGTAEAIGNAFPPDRPLDGERAYSAFRILKSLGKSVETIELAARYSERCFEDGLVVLACKFVEEFDLLSRISEATLRRVSDTAAARARLGQILVLQSTFRHVDFRSEVTLVLHAIVARGNVNVLLQHAMAISSLLDGDEEMLLSMLVRKSCTAGVSCKEVRRFIRTFGVHAEFADVSVITQYNGQREFGFMRNAVTGEQSFFHLSRIENGDGAGRLVGRLVSGIIEASTRHPGKFQLRGGRILTK